MKETGRIRTIRPFALAAGVVILLVVILAAMGLMLGFGAAGACAYVPPAQRQHSVGPYVLLFGPAVVTLFVLAYFALGFRSKLTRVIALAATLVITGVVLFVSLMFLQPICGF